ncbi:uncharacterized protein C12orf56 homolog [Brachyhypopomus gauderio]|uniref:uncharacterized protein C12orf56 homolog n=1 Tax=Brachyhypopomus gauderio TaxID=698409 RepID=UPI004042C1DC
MAKTNSLYRRNSKLETFLKRNTDRDVYERIRAYEPCVVISETVKKAFMHVVLSDDCVYLTEYPPRTLQPAVRFRHIIDIVLINDLPDFLSGREREQSLHICVVYTSSKDSGKRGLRTRDAMSMPLGHLRTSPSVEGNGTVCSSTHLAPPEGDDWGLHAPLKRDDRGSNQRVIKCRSMSCPPCPNRPQCLSHTPSPQVSHASRVNRVQPRALVVGRRSFSLARLMKRTFRKRQRESEWEEQEAELHLYAVSRSSRLYLHLQSSWNRYLMRSTLMLDPLYMKKCNKSPSASPRKQRQPESSVSVCVLCMSLRVPACVSACLCVCSLCVSVCLCMCLCVSLCVFSVCLWMCLCVSLCVPACPCVCRAPSCEQTSRLFQQLRAELVQECLAMENLHLLLQELHTAAHHHAAVRTLFWRSAELYPLLVHTLVENSTVSQDRPHTTDRLQLCTMLVETLSLMFRETELEPARQSVVTFKQGTVMASMLLAVLRDPDLRPFTCSSSSAIQLQALQAEYQDAASVLVFEVLLFCQDASHTPSSGHYLTVGWIFTTFQSHTSFVEFVGYQAQQVVLALAPSQRPLSPSQAVLLYQRCSVLLACMQNSATLRAYITTEFREEFRYFVGLSGLEDKLPPHYPISTAALHLLTTLHIHMLHHPFTMD